MDQTLQSPKSIVITGPESSGKTTLAIDLVQEIQVHLVEEEARDYLNQIKRPYTEDDLTEISQLQHDKINEAKSKNDLIVADTDLLTLKIWGEEVYDRVDLFTLANFKHQLPSLYILCSPDIPWEHDPLRENPLDRDRLFQVYHQQISELNIPFTIVSGKKEERLKQALVFIHQII